MSTAPSNPAARHLGTIRLLVSAALLACAGPALASDAHAAPAKAAQAKLEAEFGKREKDLNDAATKLKTAADKLDKDAEERNADARVWFKGLQAIKRKVGIKTIYDLSATPFYLAGSGHQEGYIFPWVVSDFSLMDAIDLYATSSEGERLLRDGKPPARERVKAWIESAIIACENRTAA